MNETEKAIHPIAEAVRGYMRDRSKLLEYLSNYMTYWQGYEDFSKRINAEILRIDQCVKELIEFDRLGEKERKG